MTELLTAAQMRAIERAAIDAGEVTGLELMERAGRGVVEAVFEEWPELAKTSHRAVVLCGPGNNGGDGFVVARLLKEWGWEVEVFLYGDASRLPPDARVNYERWIGMGALMERVGLTVEQQIGLVERFMHADPPIVFFDALFGTGLSRPIKDLLTDFDMILLNGGSHEGIRRVAVDVPSGLCSDSGRDIGRVFYAELTVSFHDRKLGHLLSKGPDQCGKVMVKSIGLAEDLRRDSDPTVVHRTEVGPECLSEGSTRSVQLSKSLVWQHKFSHGHALVLTGGSAKTGAARLAARGALRIGAGLVTLGVPGAAQMEVASQVTAIMLKRAGTAEEVASALADKRINAVCLGPGLGLERAQGLVEVVLKAPPQRP